MASKLTIQLPDIQSLATLYAAALKKSNHTTVQVAEACVMKIAASEAAAAEAAVLSKFLKSID